MKTEDDFSEALRKKASGTEIVPSENIWDGIRLSMRRRRRAAVSISVLCSLIAVFAASYGIHGRYTSVRTDRNTRISHVPIASAFVPEITVPHPKPFSGDIVLIRNTYDNSNGRADDDDDRNHNGNGRSLDDRDKDGITDETTIRYSHDPAPATYDNPDENGHTSEYSENHIASIGQNRRDKGIFTIGTSVSPSAIQYRETDPYIKTALMYSEGQNLSKRNIELEHSIPVSYGISVSYNFYKRWSAYVGIDYTLYKSSGNTHNGRMTQKLHYISVPIGISFNIIESRFIDLYITAGGSVDKCVAGNAAFTPELPGQKERPETMKLPTGGIQGSLKAGAGLSIKAVPFISIFAEPAYIRYFNGNTGISSYRTAHRNGFNISVGLRFRL